MMGRFTSRATRWALVPIVAAAALSIWRPTSLLWAERASYDTLLRFDHPRPPTGRVVIVDIDDRSLSAIGQWPWRRNVIANLIGRLRASGSASIALDVLLAEP